MDVLIEYLLVSGVIFVLACLRYLSMTSLYYAVVYKKFASLWSKYKIEKSKPTAQDIQHEIKWGLANKINFFFYGILLYWLYKNDYLAIYTDWYEYPLWYSLAVVPVLLVLHDAYFFWRHYLMHKTSLYGWTRHNVHHGVRNVSPYSAFSVHPAEGFLELAFRPIMLIFIPVHPITLGVFLIITFSLNVIGHSGYEFFPRRYPSSPLTRLGSSATFHYLHHKDGGTNFGLFLCVWDRLMGTMHPDYDEMFDRIAKESPLQFPERMGFGLLNPNNWMNKQK